MVFVEDGLREKGGRSGESRRGNVCGGIVDIKHIGLDGGLVACSVEDVDDIGQVQWTDTLVQGDTDCLVVNISEIDSSSYRRLVHGCRAQRRDVQGERIEKGLVGGWESDTRQVLGKDLGQSMRLRCNLAQADRTVVHGIHGGHVG